jgi:hypothetical protein
MKRIAVSLVLLFSMATWAARAAAEEAAPEASRDDDPTASHAIQLAASAGWMYLGTSDTTYPFQPASLLQIAPSYRVSRTLSIGAIGSYASVESTLRIWRIAGEGRYHAVRTRAFDLWGAGEAGFFVTKLDDSGYTCGGCSGSAPGTNARVAPLLGAGFGFDLLPVPYVSVGLETRALVGVFGGRDVSDQPSGLSQAFSFGATLALHVPLGE